MKGVQGDKYRKGEIFGTENLFRFKEDGSFLHDIYNILPESGKRGNDDSPGLDIHDSRKISEGLLGMTDEERNKVGEEDDLLVFQAMSGKVLSNRSRESPGSNGKQESHSADEDQAMDESIKKEVRAINHCDLFRSDRGGAAINSGEDGFDEEMGGQTQAAYEIYENMKYNLCEEVENNDDVIVGDDGDDNYRPQGKKCKFGRNQSNVQTLELKPQILNTIDETQTKSLMNPMIASRLAIAQTSPNTKNVCGGTFPSSAVANSSDSILNCAQRTLECIPESSVELKLTFDSTPTVHENSCSEVYAAPQKISKELHGNTIRNSNKTKSKVLLMGCINIDDVKTEFSAADVRRPMYGRKKKKKKKKKGNQFNAECSNISTLTHTLRKCKHNIG